MHHCPYITILIFYIKTTTFDSLISVFEAGREADDSTW